MRLEVKMLEMIPAKTKKGDPYEYAEVTYKNDRGETKSKKLYPFGDSEKVTKFVSTLVRGDVIDVQTVKNSEGFLDWVEVTKGSTEPAADKVVGKAPPSAAEAVAKPYFTPDDVRQRYIIRQSSLGHAVAFHRGDEGASYDTVIETAEEFVNFVFHKPDDVVPIDEPGIELPA